MASRPDATPQLPKIAFPTVVFAGRGDKIVVFKFKRRKNYRRKTGHRQKFTEVRVTGLTLG